MSVGAFGGERAAEIGVDGKWTYVSGTGGWRIAVIHRDGTYYVASDNDWGIPIAGPFGSEDAAKAAYLMIGGTK